MTVPSREEAARLLLSLDPPEWHVRHSRAVAEIAGWLALRAERRGTAAVAGSSGARPRRRPADPNGLDRRVVEAAALLHDVDKALAHARRGGRKHGEASARWLADQGHPELAEAVALHPVTLLVDPAGAARVRDGSIEARLVAYADKRAGQRLEPMATRFARWRRRHPHSRVGDGWSPAAAEAAWDRASRLERDVCAFAGCRPDEVGRLRWTDLAFEAARRGRRTARPRRGAPGR
jgi:integrase